MIQKAYQNDLSHLTETVGRWHCDTFDLARCNKPLARKLLEESAEFMVAQTVVGATDEAKAEAADVLIVLLAWDHRNGVNLVHEVAEKFAVVKTRNQVARP